MCPPNAHLVTSAPVAAVCKLRDGQQATLVWLYGEMELAWKLVGVASRCQSGARTQVGRLKPGGTYCSLSDQLAGQTKH
jgi:hypothetical protein